MLLFIGLGPMDRGDLICCGGCGGALAAVEQICRVMGRPPRKTYENPHGLLCPVLTLTGAENLEPGDYSSTDDTWFEGYAWTPVSCAGCGLFLGWRFDAVGGASPPAFYGLLEELLVTRREGETN